MDAVSSAAIAFVEAAYHLGLGASRWLEELLRAGLPLLDEGHGVAGVVYDRPLDGGPVSTSHLHEVGISDFKRRYSDLTRRLPPETLRHLLRPCIATTLSEATAKNPGALSSIRDVFDNTIDLLGLTAVDPTGQGVLIAAGRAKLTTLNGRSKERWQMLAAHVCAGHRLRRALAGWQGNDSPNTGLPHDAEAVLSPKSFDVTDAVGSAKQGSAVQALRQAAIQADRARGRMRQSDPAKALEIWKALVRGRWSMVDWVDSDDRRLILAVPNPPDVGSPRGLSEREMQVVTYASFGHSNQFIAYELGISESRVSMLLSSSMRKLGARTPAHLIKKARDLPGLDSSGPRD